jgi:hypothetical protein
MTIIFKNEYLVIRKTKIEIFHFHLLRMCNITNPEIVKLFYTFTKIMEGKGDRNKIYSGDRVAEA